MFDLKIRKSLIKFLVVVAIQITSLIYFFNLVGNIQTKERSKTGMMLTGLFVLVVFIIAFGKVWYQKTIENNIKKKEVEKLKKYDAALTMVWICILICFVLGTYFYVLSRDICFLGVSFGAFCFTLMNYPSIQRFERDFIIKK